MTDTTELASEKLEEIRQRYRPTEVPKCHVCGAEMTVQRMSASRITYGCTGATYDKTGVHYAEGRSIADDHYAESRITVVDVSDPDILALVEALEKAQQEISSASRVMAAQDSELTTRRQRIAELESRTVTVKLPLMMNLTIAGDKTTKAYFGGTNEGIRDTVKAFEAALTAAGIKWEAA